MKTINVGLKNNAMFLYRETNGHNLGGLTGGIHYNAVIKLNNTQFNNFKNIIKFWGYSVKDSLKKDTISGIADYSCYLINKPIKSRM